jgi:DNA-directed RNA polymerase subunit M/transcription elongation factor TFIIS
MDFCDKCQFLLEELTSTGKLMFKCNKCGSVTEARPEHTLLENEELDTDSAAKFENSIRTTPYDPINPREYNPCPKCKRTIRSYQLLGDEKTKVTVCVCGFIE